MQKEMAFLVEAGKPKMLPQFLIESCRNAREALLACFENRTIRYTQSTLAELIGMDKAQFSRFLSGSAHFPDAKRQHFMELCGNLAPVQFDLWINGLSAVAHIETPEEENQRLRVELAKFKEAV